jgi:hypothetical protein
LQGDPLAAAVTALLASNRLDANRKGSVAADDRQLVPMEKGSPWRPVI